MLAASTDLSYRELAVMAVGQLDIVDGVAGVTGISGKIHLIEAVPMRCCAGRARSSGGGGSSMPR